MKILLDTNICIYLINKKNENVLKKFDFYKTGEIGISSISYSELIFGAYKSSRVQQNLDALNEFILPLEIFPFDDEAGFSYGRIRTLLEKKGVLIGPMDLLIGSHAISMKIPIVTNNEREFIKIPELQIINWVKNGV